MKDLIDKQVAIVRLCFEGNEPTKFDLLYTKKALNKIVKIVHELEENLYITDFFMSEFVNEKNDYCHYGFLVINDYVFSELS